MAVVVEPVLNPEKILALLAEAHEQPGLDYKRSLDVSTAKGICEFAKDVGAMRSEDSGGYILVGCDDNGQPVSDLTESLAQQLDESKLRAKLKKYISEPFEIKSAIHQLADGARLALIYVAPDSFGYGVFANDGEYEVTNANGTVKKEYAFRAGDVFVRHGTASERWNDADRARIRERIIAREKNSWRKEIRSELVELSGTVGPGRAAHLPSSALSWSLDSSGFDELVTELIRSNDDIPIRSFLLRVPVEVSELFTEGSSDLDVALGRVASVAALGLQFDRNQWSRMAIEALEKMYAIPGLQGDFPADKVAAFWFAIAARVHAIGGLAVRLENWHERRFAATRRPGVDLRGEHYGSWIRHAVTMAARANQLNERNSDLIARARKVCEEVSAVRPDVPADSDQITDSLCQFDVYAALAVINDRGGPVSGNFYPSFGKYYARRSAPAFRRIVTDPVVREVIFPGSDGELATAINEMHYRAENENIMTYSVDGDTLTQPVVEFLRANQEDNA